jgi:hypothetical protein
VTSIKEGVEAAGHEAGAEKVRVQASKFEVKALNFEIDPALSQPDSTESQVNPPDRQPVPAKHDVFCARSRVEGEGSEVDWEKCGLILQDR